MKFIYTLVFLLISLGYCSMSELPSMNFKFHYNELSEKRHPFYKDGQPWRRARKYVRTQFQKYGLRNITEQTFNSFINDEPVEGVNIIGLMEGSNKNGPIIIVGADYDTSKMANQHKDNTGGIASLLEVIHIFCDRTYWNPFHQNNTVIFVAFDLNTKEYHSSGLTKPGSHHFIHQWFLPYMEEIGRKSKFQGAIIMDSITTYNIGENTQELAEGFDTTFPKAYKDIVANGNRGDFLGFVYTKSENNNSIIKSFSKNYDKSVMKSLPYRLQRMETELSFDLLREEVKTMIDHQSHYYFWTNENEALPAFLLFDTDNYREDPHNVCRANCSVEEFLTEDRIQFMERTTTAVWKTLIELQTTEYPIPDSCGQINPAIVLILSTFLMTFGLLK